MRIVIGLLAFTAVACGDDAGGLPVGGGNDGGGLFPDGSLIDSAIAVDAAIDGSVLAGDAQSRMGRVCLTSDPRKLNCETSSAGGLTVKLGSVSTLTAADGSFTLVGGTGEVWEVSGTSIVTSHMPIGDYEIPAIPKTVYQQMITDNLQGLTLNPGEGSVMVFVLSNGFGVTGAVADSAPSASWEPFYDQASSPTDFVQTATGADGMVWITGLDVGDAAVDITYNAETVNISGLPVFDGHITFGTAIFPIP